jgi:hypothetical protein
VLQPALAGDSSQAIADRVKASNVEIANNFSPAWGIQCSPPQGDDHFAIRCHAELSDAERSPDTASLDFLIYDTAPDFDGEDAQLAAAVQRLAGRWKIADRPAVSVDGPAGTIHPKTSCHQALGDSNGAAYCLIQAEPRVLILSRVGPAQPSTDAFTEDRASATYQDTRRATALAAMGVMHVIKAR